MMIPGDDCCSRCHLPISGFVAPESVGFTAGYYVATAWPSFADPGDTYICDACMWSDPRYIRIYGRRKSA